MAQLPDTIHVLLVDDEQLSRFVVGNLLRKCNYAVTVVDSGAQALELLNRSAPGTFQLILTDLMMPEVDGLDILRYVRGNILLRDLPVVMMSANEQKDTVFQAIKSGAEEYLVKPVTKKEVQNIWQYVWKRLQASSQQQAPPVALQLEAQQLLLQPAQQAAAQVQVQQQQVQAAQVNGTQLAVQQQQQRQLVAAPASGTAATAAAGAAAAIHRAGSSRGVRHLQQQQKLLQQQHIQNQLQQRQQHQQASAQQQELLQSMQQLHNAQQQAVFQPDRCTNSSNLHSQVLLGKLQPHTPQQHNKQQQVCLQRQQGVCLQQLQQQHQQGNQEDFESLAFFLSTLHGHRSAEAATVRASVADLDAQIAQVQAALKQLQPQHEQQQQELLGGGGAPAVAAVGSSGAAAVPQRPRSAGSGHTGETTPESNNTAAAAAGEAGLAGSAPAAAAATAQAPAAAAVADRADSKRGMDVDSEDDDDLEMERRERSRRHKRQRVLPAQQQQQQGSRSVSPGAAAVPSSQLQLQRQMSSTVSGVTLLDVAAGDRAALPAQGHLGAPAAGDADGAGVSTAAAAAAAGVSVDTMRKWQHVSGKFDTLQAVYTQQKQAWQSAQQQDAPTASAAAAAAVVTGASADGSSSSGARSGSLPGFLQGFGDDLWGYSRYSRLAVRGTVRAAADLLGGGSAMVCAAGFDRDDEYLATAGVSKRIRIFEYAAITNTMYGAVGGGGVGAAGAARRAAQAFGGSSSSLSGSEGPYSGGNGGTLGGGAAAAAQDSSGVVYPVLELSSRSRLSCVAWSPYVKAQLASSDYEGVVQLWDANNGSEIMQLEEHSKRAWAVDFSRLEPTRLVSSSDDGTVKLWSIHQESSVGTLQLHANVCSVQFSPESPHLLAAGCANYRFYLFDLRNTAQPLVCVPGHRRSVSYVRWLDGQQLVTASTDNTLRRWSVPELLAAASTSTGARREVGGAGAAAACKMTYRGHTNNRNFIGLSVLPGAPGAPPSSASSSSSSGGCGGYVVCGSETNEAYVYHSSMPMPVTAHSFQPLSQPPWGLRQTGRGSASDLGGLADLTEAAAGGKSDMFVSCVAWNRRQGTVVAANSAGHIQVLELV